ncbi:hypothetical protein ABOM_001116 [Aspergillus bombycis]|uniref:Zn(2)-C6 fungal-type domain-containing protein n=1 Tax=Aspergillus bombycis TaxID=109264 RepID=A0A1F8AFL6_9EURO|nr:hypothetical protein ABOM_001116 [Aspergillus bombycis]OGM50199.1 hypothetical protein ABOM_001116 [Aspergillus bombycis]
MQPKAPSRRHACVRCIQLKVKCVPVENGRCQRCARLDRHCAFPDGSRRNTSIRNSRVDIIQHQIDTLAAQLYTEKGSRVGLPPTTETPSPSTISSTSLQPSPVPEPFNDFITRGLLNITQGEELLLKFRTDLIPLFPFVILPEVNFVELRKQSPFLLLCIITACLEHKPTLQQKLESEARTVVSTRIVMNMERDMDTLRGLLVHIAWYHDPWRIYHTQVYMLLQMAMAIVVDLGLDRYNNFKMQCISYNGKGTEELHKGQVLYLTSDGQRAFLGLLSMFQSLGQQSELEVEDPIRAMSKDELFQSMDVLENQIEHLLVQETQWSLRFELKAIPAIVLGHALRQQRDVHRQYEKQQRLTIARSAFNIVMIFLASPASVTPNLPMFSYTSIWYGLLVLSKLSLLSDTATRGKAVEVYNKDIHNLGLAAMQKMEAMSRRNDVWDNCRTVIGSMLSWLESSRTQPQSVQVRGDTSNTQDAENAHMLPQPIPEYPPRATESAAVVEDWDATVWQQMLQDLTWIELPVE